MQDKNEERERENNSIETNIVPGKVIRTVIRNEYHSR